MIKYSDEALACRLLKDCMPTIYNYIKLNIVIIQDTIYCRKLHQKLHRMLDNSEIY